MKIGILTLFHRNYNYGGCLQAYALCHYLIESGYDAKQIAYDIFQGNDPRLYKLRKQFLKESHKLRTFVRICINYIRFVTRKMRTLPYSKQLKHRMNNFDLFIDTHIAHTREYSEDELKMVGKMFDHYIVGSDQVWNPEYQKISDCFFLDFVDKTKGCTSYAASISRNQLDDKDKLKELLQKFSSISVRESTAKELLEPLCNMEISVVIDPTLLLTKDKWDEIVNSSPVASPYIFCYFLGDNPKHREFAKRVKSVTGFSIIDIPFGQMNFKKCDIGYSDKTCVEAGPSDFLSLIKNADVVVTDSFHACVFSVLYHKKFYVVKRFDDYEMGSMNSRITDFINLLHLQDCLVEKIECFDDATYQKNIDYAYADKIILKQREEAKEFILRSLNSDDKRILEGVM